MHADRRVARRRRLLVAAGIAPLALTILAWAAIWIRDDLRDAPGAVSVLVIFLVVGLGLYAGAPLVAAIRVQRARPEDLDVVAPVVWCTLASAAAGVGLIVAASVSSDLAIQTLWPGLVVQTLGWVAGDRIGRRRLRDADSPA